MSKKCFVCDHPIIPWEQAPRYASIEELVKENVQATGEMQQYRLNHNPLAREGYDHQWVSIAVAKVISAQDLACYNCGRILSAEDTKRLLADDIVRAVLMKSAQQDVPPDQNTPPEL